ncbi:hypothetical protein [Actinocorallia populi]|uniref:hypothetical protein n=1 Tax=Actinocorallia populi TaxID=2079200 RepID=UPI001300B070|nr:hypothetical protein [Actinocorallia populi]
MLRRDRTLSQRLVDAREADRANRAIAARMDGDFPCWVVLYSPHRGSFSAFPLHRAPVDVDEDTDPDKLADRMRAVDEALYPTNSLAVAPAGARPGDGQGPFLARQVLAVRS